MSYTEKQMVATYTNLFEGLSDVSKIELIQYLSKSLNKKKKIKKDKIYIVCISI